MSRQILQNNSPSRQELRTAAYQNLGQGIVDNVENYARFQKEKEATDRQKALELMAFNDSLAKSGISPNEQYTQAFQKGDAAGLAGLYEQKAEQARNQKLFEQQKEKEASEFRKSQQALNNEATRSRINQGNEGLRLKREELASADPYNKLPQDNKQIITKLAQSNAGKTAIVNAIDSVMKNWDNLSKEEQLTQGRQLIKTLNSTQGQDAVGAEEAKRLAGKLEFATGNLFSDNPVQFGYDLGGFKQDANITSTAIKNSIIANQKEIDRAYGRPVRDIQDIPIPREQMNLVGLENNQQVPYDPRNMNMIQPAQAAQPIKLMSIDPAKGSELQSLRLRDQLTRQQRGQ